jgi:hypothetical protein
LCTLDGGFQKLFIDSICDMKKHIWSLYEESFKLQCKDTEGMEKLYTKKEKRDVLSYTLWNKYLNNKNLLGRKRELIDKGIVYVRDIVSKEGRFMSYNEFCKTFNIEINILDYYSMIHSLPVQRRREVLSTGRNEKVENTWLEEMLRQEKVCKYVYQNVIKSRAAKNPKRDVWSNKLGVDVSEEEWTQLFTSIRITTVCSVLRSFQYIFMHRAIVTNEFLFRGKIKDSDKCYFCRQETETMEHLFWNCQIIGGLWSEFAGSLAHCLDINCYLCEKNVMLGINDTEHADLINYLFILVERYIYVQRCKEKDISMQGLLAFVKRYYNIDRILEADKNAV